MTPWDPILAQEAEISVDRSAPLVRCFLCLGVHGCDERGILSGCIWGPLLIE